MRLPLTLAAVMLTPVPVSAAGPTRVRFATYNVFELSRAKLDAVDAHGRGTHPQLRKAAEVVQRVRPDVLLVNEIDYDAPSDGRPGGENARLFLDRYLKVAQGGQQPLDYPHVFTAPVNTGVPSGKDLNNNGKADDPEDALGYGKYPGQYGMALYSRHRIDAAAARMFQNLLWKDVPGHLMPDGRGGRPAYYGPEQAAVLRLSSKSHWDVPVRVNGRAVHALCSHPTPPVFDGPEDRNGRRNHDEIRLWADYLTGGDSAVYLRDDAGKAGGLPAGAAFVILGDLNAEPVRGDAVGGRRPIDLLLKHPRVADPRPRTEAAAAAEGPDLPDYKPFRTHPFGRLDYALPSRDLRVLDAGVFWPAAGEAQRALVDPPNEASDHRLVWVDVAVPAVEVVGHRGASHDAPENTLAAVKLAWEQGADAAEFDVYLSKDGKAVVIHDKDTKRTAGVARAVVDQTLDELRRLDVGRWKGPRFAGERVPTIDEVLATVPAGKRAFVEVKCGPEAVPEVDRAVRSAGLKPEQVAVISFDDRVVAAMKAARPDLKAYWIVSLKPRNGERPPTPAELVARARGAKADGLDLSATPEVLTPVFGRAVKDAGLELLVWTVNDPDLARRMIDAGADGLTTDRPGWLRDRLAGR